MRCAHVWTWGYGLSRRCSAHAIRGVDGDGKRRCFAHSRRTAKDRKRAARNRLAARVGGSGADEFIADERARGVENRAVYGARRCRRCGARAWSRCRTRRGHSPYPWSYVHVERRFDDG